MVAKIYVTGGIGESFWYWFAFDRDPVSNDATSTEDLIRIIRNAHASGNLEAIECTIASCPGGDAIMGIEMHDILRTQGVPVTTRAIGLCASAGGVIFAAGDDRIATPRAMFLPHKVTGYGGGNAQDLQDTADTIRMLDNQIASAYATASGRTVEYWAEVMGSEKMLNAQDMLAHGLVTAIGQVVPLNHSKIQTGMKLNFSGILDTIRGTKNALPAAEPVKPANEVPATEPTAPANAMIETDKGTVNVEGEVVAGAKATVDGKPANGRYMPTDGSRGFECENGEIKIIIEKEEEDPMENTIHDVLAELASSHKALAEAMQAQTTAMNARFEALEAQNKAAIEAQNAQQQRKVPQWPITKPPVTGAENTMPQLNTKLAPAADGSFQSTLKTA